MGEPRALCRMLWRVSGGYHTAGSASMLLQIPPQQLPRLSQSHKEKEQNSYTLSSPPGFSHLLPTLVGINKLVDLDLLCLDRKIYF